MNIRNTFTKLLTHIPYVYMKVSLLDFLTAMIMVLNVFLTLLIQWHNDKKIKNRTFDKALLSVKLHCKEYSCCHCPIYNNNLHLPLWTFIFSPIVLRYDIHNVIWHVAKPYWLFINNIPIEKCNKWFEHLTRYTLWVI